MMVAEKIFRFSSSPRSFASRDGNHGANGRDKELNIEFLFSYRLDNERKWNMGLKIRKQNTSDIEDIVRQYQYYTL